MLLIETRACSVSIHGIPYFTVIENVLVFKFPNASCSGKFLFSRDRYVNFGLS